LFLLRPSAPRTGEIASGFWPTPATPNGGRTWPEDAEIVGNSAYRPNGQKVQIHLHHMVEGHMWPTPRASANENRQTKPTPSQLAGTHGKSLAAEVSMSLIPTPDANCWKGSESLEQRRGQLTEARLRMMPTPRHEGFDAGGHRGTNDSLHSAVKATTTGKLSAAWVSVLMGFPPDWTNLED
jgi:hypothetical protein